MSGPRRSAPAHDPHRRARPPGRGRLRELARRPELALRAVDPRSVASAARGAAGEDRLVGLMMLRDEDDVLEEVLASAVRWFDRILVLDGTRDPARRERTEAILAARPEVVHVARDDDVAARRGRPGPVRDGARQLLLDEARRRYGADRWIGVLHGDEFVDRDPRPLLAARRPLLDPTVRVRLVHGFLHVDDRREWAASPDAWSRRPVRERIRHVMWPGVPETRFFFDRGTRDYALDHHSKVVPTSFRAGPLEDGFCVVQYNERSPAQAVERARARSATGWQHAHYQRFLDPLDDVFVDSLDRPGRPFAPEFGLDPLGPFRPALVDDVPLGPRLGAGAPLVVPAGEAPAAPALAGAPGGAARRRVDLGDVAAPGGLLDAVDEDDARARRRLALGWRHAATAAARPVDLALIELTARLVASRRLDRSARRRVAREHVLARHGDGDRWWAPVPAGRADAVRRLLAAPDETA